MPDITIYELIENGQVVGFKASPWNFSPGQTQQTRVMSLPDVPGETAAARRGRAMSAYEGRLRLGIDVVNWKPGDVASIAANTSISVTISTNTGATSITLRLTAVDDTGAVLTEITQAVGLSAGQGSLTFTPDNPARVLVTPDDRATYTAAGRGIVEIEVTE